LLVIRRLHLITMPPFVSLATATGWSQATQALNKALVSFHRCLGCSRDGGDANINMAHHNAMEKVIQATMHFLSADQRPESRHGGL
jgi:hypothetical protein